MNEHPTDLLPAFAIGCLDEGEALMVREHLAGCPSCRKELESFQAVSDALSLLSPQGVPSEGLASRIAERGPASVPGAGSAAAQQPTRRPAPRWTGKARFVWLAAAAVLIAALAAGNVLQLLGRPGDVATARGGLATAVLLGSPSAKDAYGTIVLDPEDNKGVLAVRGLPALAPTLQYQLWLARDGKERGAGVFSVDADGYGSMILDVPRDFRDFRTLSITVEPKGGSAVPTGAVVMSGGL